MYIRICLVCILFLGMLTTPITVSADEEKSTNIEIEQTWHYDPNTNIYSGFMSNAGDDDDDIVVRAKIDGTNEIASDDIVFELYELPHSDMNHNGKTGEKLYETGGITHYNDRRWTNFGNWFFASENIPKVYKNKEEHGYLEDLDAIPQANLPKNGNYNVKIKYRGIPGIYKGSEKTITLTMTDDRHPTHIDVISTSYSNSTNVFTTNRRAFDPQFNLAGKTWVDDVNGEFIRNTLYFELWEKPGTDMNNNGKTGEYLYREADDASSQSYSQVNIASWFKDINEVKNLPNGQYNIKIYSPGERWYKISSENITLDIGP
jgi:hypothetical protein